MVHIDVVVRPVLYDVGGVVLVVKVLRKGRGRRRRYSRLTKQGPSKAGPSISWTLRSPPERRSTPFLSKQHQYAEPRSAGGQQPRPRRRTAVPKAAPLQASRGRRLEGAAGGGGGKSHAGGARLEHCVQQRRRARFFVASLRVDGRRLFLRTSSPKAHVSKLQDPWPQGDSPLRTPSISTESKSSIFWATALR